MVLTATTVAHEALRLSEEFGGYVHRYRTEADVLRGVLLVGGFAALTGLAAQVRIPLPFTPVPITLQTFAVLLAGIVLGARYAGLSQGLYVGAGAAGVPWFAGASGGLVHLAGPTGGYLVGMVLAALLVGLAVDRFPIREHALALIAVLAVANAVVYAVGLPWLWVWSTVLSGAAIGAWDVLVMGLFPFVAGDAVKLFGAIAVARLIAPPEDCYDDVDAESFRSLR